MILGHTTDLTQRIRSLEIGHQKVPGAVPGQRVALKVDEPVRRGDEVYRVLEEVKSLVLVQNP